MRAFLFHSETPLCCSDTLPNFNSDPYPKHAPKHAPNQVPKQTPKQFSPKHAPKHAPKQFPKQTPKQLPSKHAARFGQGKLARNFLQSILQSMIQKNASKQKYPIS